MTYKEFRQMFDYCDAKPLLAEFIRVAMSSQGELPSLPFRGLEYWLKKYNEQDEDENDS